MRRLQPFAIGFLALAVAACSQVNSQDILEDITGSGSSLSSVSSATVIGERVLSGGILEIGNANADVTMQLFINHDSRYSRQFHSFMPMLQREFIEKGTLKIDIIPVAFKKYPESTKHAKMLLCAAKQGRGFAMNSLLMGGTETLLPAGTNKVMFDGCMTDTSPLSSVHDVSAVPTYIINGERYTGVPTEADLVGSVIHASR